MVEFWWRGSEEYKVERCSVWMSCVLLHSLNTTVCRLETYFLISLITRPECAAPQLFVFLSRQIDKIQASGTLTTRHVADKRHVGLTLTVTVNHKDV